MQDGPEGAFEEAVRAHPLVDALTVIQEYDAETLYGLEWDAGEDPVFEGLRELDAHLLEASGSPEEWVFEIRFEDHGALAAFQDHCNDVGIVLGVDRIYNPVRSDGEHYGLTAKQREALLAAYEAGYYLIPRQTATVDLAAELGVSDQAVTERLRRGIHALIENTIAAAEAGRDPADEA